MHIRVSRIVRDALVFVATFSLTLELCARVDDFLSYGAPFWSTYNYRILLVDQPGEPRHNRPNARFEKWKINNLGFRGRDVALQKPSDSLRIVCFGASESFGLYEREGGEWPSRLGRFLERCSPPVQVINASVVGMKPEQYHAYLDKYVWPLQPDIVILQPGFWSHARESGEKALGRSRPSNPRQGSEVDTPAQTLGETLRFPQKLRSALKKHLPPSLVEYIAIWQASNRVRAAEERTLQGRAPLDTLSGEATDLYEREVDQLVRDVKDHGALPVLSTSPFLIDSNNKEEYRRELLDSRRGLVVFSDEGISDAALKFNDRIRAFALQSDVVFVDNDKLLPKTRAYFGDSLHYTDKGADLVARNYLDSLKSRVCPGARSAN